jgi:hypothetical protein
MLYHLRLLSAVILVCSYQLSAPYYLKVKDFSENFLDGFYMLNDGIDIGIGVNFVSTPNSLQLLDANGSTLVYSELRANNALIAVIADTGFIMSNGDLYYVPNNLLPYIKMLSADPADLLSKGVYNNNAFIRLQSAIEKLHERQESTLLKGAAFALSKEGITGYDNPSVMLFYKFAQQMVRYEQNRKLPVFNATKRAADYVNDGDGDDDDCLQYCPPCPDYECLGLCGYGCSCWEFICGDCCYHLGCYDHDVCCRQNMFDINCWLPFGFSCEENYYCRNGNGNN